MRAGVSSARGTIVVKVAHVEGGRTLVGLVVSKAIGGAVVRNAVKRRLRAIVSEMMEALPPGRAILVRALPSAAGATYGALKKDVQEATRSALKKETS